MSNTPEIHCNAWEDGEIIPIEYTAPISPNLDFPGNQQPENRKPDFTFTDIPPGTRTIALVVHDVLDGDPVDGVRPGWTHYTAIFDAHGKLLTEGTTSEDEPGWIGPYPEKSGEYHCTAYFLSRLFTETEFTRAIILEEYRKHGLASANTIGNYTNPTFTG